MKTTNTPSIAALIRAAFGASLVLLAGLAGAATVSVNLTAARMNATMPDGASVPMWGYCTTPAAGSCSGPWAPGPTITAAAGDTLSIKLTNSLPVPTSLVILGQLGGGLGTPVKVPGPAHAGQAQTTWPGNGAASLAFTPPAQGARVTSFATELPPKATAATELIWANLKPGTYLYETGTQPSIQAPMGLYGVLIVTQAPVPADTVGNTPFVPGVAYPAFGMRTVAAATYDSDVAMLFSEIDPVQNAAADAAAMAGTDWMKRFNDSKCGTKCYPAAVNYTPTYFLINGRAFDKTQPTLSALAVPATYSSGSVLVRLLNAGSRTHVPSIVGLSMAIVAEDGNLAPGTAKTQNEVLLTAGKTHDLLVKPPTSNSTSPAYATVTFPVFDRTLSLTSNNQPDSGMQAFLQVAGGTLPTAVTPKVVDDIFQVPLNTMTSGNVKLNDIAITSVTVDTSPASGSLLLNADGSFVYTPNTGFSGTDTFTYIGNGSGAAGTATVTLKVASKGTGAPPVANADNYSSNVATKFAVSRPGVLANDTDPSGYPLKADPTSVAASSCASVSLSADGSFTATPGSTPASCSFTYKATNSQGTPSAPATVTVAFGAAGSKTGLEVVLTDAQSGVLIKDYRWVIQEDLTFKHDIGATPSLSTRTVGTSFHRSHMTVVATGCVGAISCGSGQTIRTDSVGMGARHAMTVAEALLLQTMPGDVTLDPSKNYYISVLPATAGNPVGGCADTDPTICPADGSGNMMGGAEIKPRQTLVSMKLQQTPLVPAQVSIYIYEDNSPVNGQNDVNENSNGLGGFNIILMDPAGRVGDVAGQQTYDAFNMPLTNALLGTPGCPDDLNKVTNGTSTTAAGNLVGAVYTCPNAPPGYTGDPAVYALAGHALMKNITPARYDVIAHPAAARQGLGEVWWQTETLEGTAAQDAFVGVKEPKYFQEFGPPGIHVTIGFVNPDKVKKYANDNGLVGSYFISGKITNSHMSRPNDVTIYDSGSYDMLSSTTCQVALNSQAGDGPAIAITQCDPDGSFKLTGVPAGDYEIAIWDQWLDQIIQTKAVTVVKDDVALGNIPVLSWFTQYDQNIFLDTNKNGVFDPGEKGISNLLMTSRYRNGSIHMQTATDSSGNGLLAEMFPLFNWYVVEADTTRFKQTGVNVIVDGGGKPDTSGDGAGLWTSKYATGESSVRTEVPGAYSYGLQSFISQRNTVNWGRTPYVAGENGGIQGTVVYSSTRPFDDQRYNVQNIWAPLVPRVTVNLYREEQLADGTKARTLVDSTQTSSWDDYVNLVYGSDGNKYLLGTDGSLHNPTNGALAPPGTTAGIQVNMQCPGQTTSDPFYQYTLALQNSTSGPDQFRCYDGWHNWNQVQAAPYDGRYAFPSAAYIAAHPLTPEQVDTKQTLVSLPKGNYVVESVTPTGYEVVKEEDKNILVGDAFVAPAVTQFGGLGSIFILPDQATLNNANPFNPNTGDAGVQSNPTSNLGATASQLQYAECVGNLHRVPDYLSIFPQAQQVAPFAGMDRPLCDVKRVVLGDQMQAGANFFVFTSVPVASNNTGIILDDASSEFNSAAPDFGEKASVPFVPVSIKDFSGMEITRTYSDQWGAYNMMTPSSWLVNPPTPSGYGPNMLITCMNDPGPIPVTDPTGKVRMITDPAYNPAYSNFCYTKPFMPGLTDYLDTPVLPIAAFASGYNPADCEYPDATPAIARVDSGADGEFGPYLPASGGTLIITALGDRTIMNPAYAGPFATSGVASQRTVTRHYGFGSNSTGKGSVSIGNVMFPSCSTTVTTNCVASWSDKAITLTMNGITPSGELVITADNGRSSVDAVTVTMGGTAPVRVQATAGQTIQAAVDAATPGDLIMVDAGTYNELVIMWKPVRLQGVGAASVIINAAKYPNDKVQGWRDRVNALFSIDMVTGNQNGTAQVDPLPTQEITGGVVLLEPSVLGTEEGAGITVLAKQLWDGTTGTKCGDTAPSTFAGAKVGDSVFGCPGVSARIDGVSVTGGDSGGGIYVNGWAHNLEIANNRVYGNAGAFNGGVRVGIPYLELESLPVDGTGNVTAFGYDKNVRIHHNAITKNGTVEGPAGNGGAGGGVSICTGTDGYSVDHNWVCGNNSASDGGGIGHIGFSQGGRIANNTVLFNQSFQQTTSTHGGGIYVGGEPPVAGTLSLGTGNLTIDANLIRGNFAEGGQGGGIRLQQVNGADVAAHPTTPASWFAVTVTNNMIDNNVAAWAGGGISLADTLSATIINNTVSANDTTGTAGVVLSTVGAVALPASASGTAGVGHPMPSGIAAELTSAALRAVVASQTFSNPTLTNNIVWQNRSFFYSGDGHLCASNNAADAAAATRTCAELPNQTTTGQNVNGNIAKFWDIGVFGDTSPTPGANKLNPTYSVMTSTTGYTGVGNKSDDPLLADVYFNGSRVTPEFGIVTNPPSVLNMQVAATVDEGNNYVNVRYGPLYLTKPGEATTFGDYHLVDTPTTPSPAVDAGVTVLAVNHDFDGRGRPQGAKYDIGAHEVAQVGVSPSALAFGNQPVLTTSAPQIVTLSNPRTVALTGIAVALSGSNATDFGISNSCGATLPAGQNCNISVTFAPSLLGAKTATVAVSTLVGTFNVALSGTGTGPLYSVTPSSLSFPNTVVATTSAPQSVTVRNNQTVAMSFTQVALNGAFGAQYAIAAAGTTCNTTTAVAPGGTCAVNVTFKPQTILTLGGVRPGTLALTAAALPTNVGLSGTAILFAVDVTPKGFFGINGTLNFPATQVGQESAALTATLTNYQSTPVTFNSVAMPSQFKVVPGAGTTCRNGSAVAANGGTCTIAIDFAPNAVNTLFGFPIPWMQTATLNLGGSTVNPTITLTGTARSSAVSGAGTFGNQKVGTTHAAQTFTYTNSGATPVTITGVTLTGTNAANYAISSNGCATVAAGASCAIGVTFTPSAKGSRTATLNVVGAGGTQTVALSGAGT